MTAELLALARAKGAKIATAESCTGGLIAAALTEVTDGGADAEASVKDLATTVRTRLGMKE